MKKLYRIFKFLINNKHDLLDRFIEVEFRPQDREWARQYFIRKLNY